MISLVFPFNGSDDTLSPFDRCLSPDAVPGDEVSTKHEVTSVFGRNCSRPGCCMTKEVKIQNLPADHAYFMDQCEANLSLIKIDSTARYFFPENSQHIDLIKPHIMELLSRKILVLTPAPAVPPEPVTMGKTFNEDGIIVDVPCYNYGNIYYNISKPRLIAESGAVSTTANSGKTRKLRKRPSTDLSDAVSASQKKPKMKSSTINRNSAANRNSIAESGENISGPIMHLALPVRKASHKTYPWVIKNPSLSHRSNLRFCDSCRVIATKTFEYNKISFDELTAVTNAIQDEKLSDMLKKQCEFTKSNTDKFYDYLYNKLLITHFSAPLKQISMLSRNYIKILQEEMDSSTFLLKVESNSDLKTCQKDMANKLASALTMARKIDNLEKQQEGTFQKYFDILSHLLTARLSIHSSLSIPLPQSLENIEEPIITTLIPLLEKHLDEMDFSCIKELDNPIGTLNTTLTSYKYNPQIPKLSDTTRVDSITQVGISLLEQLSGWNQQLEKLHKQSTNPINNAYDALFTEYVTNPTSEAADFGCSSLATA